MDALDKLIETARQTLAHTSKTLEILNSMDKSEQSNAAIAEIEPKKPEIEKLQEVSEPATSRQKIIEEVFGDTKVKVFKKKSKKWGRNYNVDYSDLMNQIRNERIPLRRFTPRSVEFGAPLTKKLRGERNSRPIQNPNYKNSQEVNRDHLCLVKLVTRWLWRKIDFFHNF